MNRPKHTQKDSNHKPIVKELRKRGYVVIDVADLPGNEDHNPLDLFVAARDQAPVIVAYTAAQIEQAVWHAQGGWVQVELKPDWRSEFTENEDKYLDQSTGRER